MDPKTAAQKIAHLTKQINYYNEQYFQHAHSDISDYEFDQLVKQLNKLEEEFPNLKSPASPTQHIGEVKSTHFPSAKHKYPMLSLNNTYNIDELKQFVTRIEKLLPEEKINFFCELKLDGVAISLLYKNGHLERVATRGDGREGDNITLNATTIQTIPLHIQATNLPREFEVRGEVFMQHKNFAALNKQLTKAKRSNNG